MTEYQEFVVNWISPFHWKQPDWISPSHWNFRRYFYVLESNIRVDGCAPGALCGAGPQPEPEPEPKLPAPLRPYSRLRPRRRGPGPRQHVHPMQVHHTTAPCARVPQNCTPCTCAIALPSSEGSLCPTPGQCDLGLRGPPAAPPGPTILPHHLAPPSGPTIWPQQQPRLPALKPNFSP